MKFNALFLNQCPCSKTKVIYLAFCFDVAQSQMNGAHNETWTHFSWFFSQAC